jgi:hypothetical protein
MRSYALALGAWMALAACRTSQPAPATAASLVIDGSGGTVSVESGIATGTRVVVPSGAVSSATDFTITPGTLDTLPPGATACGPIVTLGPSGATFAAPVVVSLPTIPSCSDAVLLTRTGPGSAWIEVAGATWAAEPPAITASVTHFSDFVPVSHGTFMHGDQDAGPPTVWWPPTDAGPPPACVPTSTTETSCAFSDSTDSDCDGRVSCSDSDCHGMPGACPVCSIIWAAVAGQCGIAEYQTSTTDTVGGSWTEHGGTGVLGSACTHPSDCAPELVCAALAGTMTTPGGLTLNRYNLPLAEYNAEIGHAYPERQLPIENGRCLDMCTNPDGTRNRCRADQICQPILLRNGTIWTGHPTEPDYFHFGICDAAPAG